MPPGQRTNSERRTEREEREAADSLQREIGGRRLGYSCLSTLLSLGCRTFCFSLKRSRHSLLPDWAAESQTLLDLLPQQGPTSESQVRGSGPQETVASTPRELAMLLEVRAGPWPVRSREGWQAGACRMSSASPGPRWPQGGPASSQPVRESMWAPESSGWGLSLLYKPLASPSFRPLWSQCVCPDDPAPASPLPLPWGGCGRGREVNPNQRFSHRPESCDLSAYKACGAESWDQDTRVTGGPSHPATELPASPQRHAQHIRPGQGGASQTPRRGWSWKGTWELWLWGQGRVSWGSAPSGCAL